MANNTPQPITPSFARIARRSHTLSALLAGVVFLVSTYFTLGHFNAKAAAAHIEARAAGLVPGPDGDLTESIDRLLRSTKYVAAVATLDASGGLRTIHPDLPAYRKAAAATLEHKGGPHVTAVQQNGQRSRLWGAVVVLGDDSSTTARRALFLIRNDPYAGLGTTLAVLFALTLAAMVLLSGQSVTRWFDRHVASPLTQLHGLVRDDPHEPTLHPLSNTSTRKTSLTLGRAFDELTKYVAASEARNQGIQRDAERKVRDRETRFRHRLRRAEDRATIDRLTQLRNRTFLEEELNSILSSPRCGDGTFAVIMLDVDNFKIHNDTHGHQAGDDLLRFVGELLRGSIRPEDHAVRVGGDEFLLTMPGVSKCEAQRIAQRIVKMFRQWASALEGTTRPSLSAGVATSNGQPNVDLHGLIAQADTALYKAKRAGKNMVNAI